MGRFEAPVDFYRYREPYPPLFFETAARQLSLNRDTRLLDVACGPGILALGFASFVGTLTAIDPEPAMLRAAKAAAAEAHVDVRFFEAGIEQLDSPAESFDFVTIGRALHWLNRDAAVAVLERIVAPGGRIAICGSSATESEINDWTTKYKQVRNEWPSERDEARYRPKLDEWFAPSRFRRIDDIVVKHRHAVTIDELIGRALSFSVTSPAVVGERQPEFEAAIRSALAPFAKDGRIEEELAAKATVFG